MKFFYRLLVILLSMSITIDCFKQIKCRVNKYKTVTK
jgi:hypothetical protein